MGPKCDQSPTRFCARPIHHLTESAETAPNLIYCIWQMMPKDKEDGKRAWAPHDYGPNLVVAPLVPVTRGFDPRAEGRANTRRDSHARTGTLRLSLAVPLCTNSRVLLLGLESQSTDRWGWD
ncbi:hypothetical protein EV2_034113 [Malus domestica]